MRCINRPHCPIQTQAKAVVIRDYASERLQRTAGRQSSGPDPRRSSLVSFDSEGRGSRESTPRLGSSAGLSAPPSVRRPRKFLCRIINFFSTISQHRHLISQIAHLFTSLLLLNRRYAHSSEFCRSHTWLSKKLWSVNTLAEEVNYVDVKLAISSRLMSIKPVGSGISWYNRGISRLQMINLRRRPQ